MASTSRITEKAPSAPPASSLSPPSPPPPPSVPQRQWKYDVFVSFRGKDTRTNFTDHLLYALRQKGIIVFMDDIQLERGKSIQEEILKAIQASRLSVIVFSRNYAFSPWCMEELEAIFQWMEQGRQVVLPIFYDVDPCEGQEQTGRYGEAFAKHQQAFSHDFDKVHRWKHAMTQVANLSGWDIRNRHESKCIQEIVDVILSHLPKSSRQLSKVKREDLVGMDSHLEKMNVYMDLAVNTNNDVRVIGICGMGGIGKSTIARVVYEEMSYTFEGSSFLDNVRAVQQRHGLVHLQEQLLSETIKEGEIRVWNVHRGTNEIRSRLQYWRVLVILDNVDQLDQLNVLAGNRNWFGCGSRIIITTRDEHLLRSFGVDITYRVEDLSHDQSFQLFCLMAFRKEDRPSEEYEDLSYQFVNYASCLPLALTVLGSYLCGRSIQEWRSALDKLRKIPNRRIMDDLQISFDGLDMVEKKLFLDVACFFVGQAVDHVKEILESCDLYPEIGISVLIDKSLVTVSNGKIWMHDLLQQMGREIVVREHEEPGRRSRLWLHEDLHQILTNNSGTEKVEGIVLDSCDQKDLNELNGNGFLKLKKLRLLKLRNVKVSNSLKYLSNELRYLEWHGYPFKSLPSAFKPTKLVMLHMHHSNIAFLWKGTTTCEMMKVIDLSHSRALIRTPDFRQVPNLEELNFEGCTSLSEIHQSIGVLTRLVSLNLKNCKNLVGLPSSIQDLKSLKILLLHGCSRLDRLPAKLGDMTSLEELDVGGTAVRQQEAATGAANPWDFLPGLRLLSRWNTTNSAAPRFPSLSALCFLRKLNLSDCSLTEEAIPNDMSCFPLLQSLNLSGNDFVSVPATINQLSKLEDIWFDNCKKLQALPDLPPGILELNMDGCSSLVTLPAGFSKLSNLETVLIANCKRLKYLPDLPPGIKTLNVEGCVSLESFPNRFEESTAVLPLGLRMSLINCLKLFQIQEENSMAFSWLKTYLHRISKQDQHMFGPLDLFLICAPGSGVPSWFTSQGTGASIRMELPPNWCNSGWMGFAVCVVFEREECQANASQQSGSDATFLQLTCYLRGSNQEGGRMFVKIFINQNICFLSDQLCLIYLPDPWQESKDWWNKRSYLAVSCNSGRRKVKDCGMRIVYNQDIQELIQSNNRASSSSSSSKNLSHQHREGNSDRKRKRSNEDYNTDST